MCRCRILFSRVCPVPVLAIAIVLFCTAPALAGIVQSGTTLYPEPPLVPGAAQHSVVTIVVSPSGSTTFASGHQIQMQTGLAGARWDIQVIRDGHDAAQQNGAGNTVFLNGALLSYPSGSDVSFTVTIDGTVPADAVSQLTILQATELDNGGNPVPGSVVLVTATVLSPSTPVASLTQATPTTVPPLTPAPTRSAGPAPAAAALLVAVAGFILIRARR